MGRRSLLGGILQALPRPRGTASRARVAQVMAKARDHVVTVAALTAADLGGFQVFHHGGWFVLFGSLLAFDFAIRG